MGWPLRETSLTPTGPSPAGFGFGRITIVTTDNQKMGQSLDQGLNRVVDGAPSHDTPFDSTDAVDFAFLKAQTFEDTSLERELLELFVAQARKILPLLPDLPTKEQADIAHLLKGSARGIGAWAAAEAAADYENAPVAARSDRLARLTFAFAAVETAIAGRLATLQT